MMNSALTQLILEGLPMPESSNDRYVCWEEELHVDLIMADGSMVRQEREKGKVWRARYSYDLLDTDTYTQALAVLQGGNHFRASVLPSRGTELVAGDFFCVSLTPATFAFSDGGEAVWHNLAFELREVTPHA